LLSGDISTIDAETIADLESFFSGRKLKDVATNLGYSDEKKFLTDSGYSEKKLSELSRED
jgi:hypothetical protein